MDCATHLSCRVSRKIKKVLKFLKILSDRDLITKLMTQAAMKKKAMIKTHKMSRCCKNKSPQKNNKRRVKIYIQTHVFTTQITYSCERRNL